MDPDTDLNPDTETWTSSLTGKGPTCMCNNIGLKTAYKYLNKEF